MPTANPAGNYAFLSGIDPYSSGVIADPGYEIVHVTFLRPVPYREGFAQIDTLLQTERRPRAALCGVELRSPVSFICVGFIEFNRGYCSIIEEWDLLVDGKNPIARTNVAPTWAPPAEPSLYGFSFTVPAAADVRPTFVVAGAGELRGGPLLEAAVIRPGETSPEAMREKAAYVMNAMNKRLAGLGVGWDLVTTVDIYSNEALDEVLPSTVLEPIGNVAIHGLRWYPSRPPIDELAYEMDCRGVRLERVL